MFPRAPTTRHKLVSDLDVQLELILKETRELKVELKRRQEEPQVAGVRHGVTLRGDLFTNQGEAYAHIYVEKVLHPGDYYLKQDVIEYKVTLRHHYATPLVQDTDIAEIGENPYRFEVSSMLHVARGAAVVWYVCSVKGFPVSGRYQLRKTNGDKVSRVTIRQDRVLQ